MYFLIFNDIIEYFFNKCETVLEYNIRELSAAKYSLLHIRKFYVLEPEDFLSVMISNQSTVHAPDLALHDIFEEATTNEIVEFTLI